MSHSTLPKGSAAHTTSQTISHIRSQPNITIINNTYQITHTTTIENSFIQISNIITLREACKKRNRGISEFGTISLRTPPPPYTNSEKHNSENWSIFLIPSLPIEIVNKTLNYIIKFVTFESTEWKLNPNNASNVYIRSDWIVFHDNF